MTVECITHEKHVQAVKLSNPTVKVVGRYEYSMSKVEYKCLRCNQNWRTLPQNMVRKRNPNSNSNGCPNCKNKFIGTEKRTEKDFIKLLKENNPTVKLVSEYKDHKNKINVKCQLCGYKWLVRPDAILYIKRKSRGSNGCRECALSNLSLSVDTFQSKLKKKFGNKVRLFYPDLFIGVRQEYIFECHKGHIFKARGTGMLTKNRRFCPICMHRASNISIEFLNKLSSKSGYYIRHALNERELRVGKYNLDGYILELNLAIEFHGDYWHGKGQNTKRHWGARDKVRQKQRTLEKQKFLLSQGFNYIEVWESEYKRNKNKIIKEFCKELEHVRSEWI